MSSIRKISTLTEWNATTKNRIHFTESGLAKIFYFDHQFNGLSVDSNYWQIVDQTGTALSFNDSMTVSIDDSISLNNLRSRHYYSGDFDIYVSYSDFEAGGVHADRYIYFGMTDEALDATDNINIRIGIGVESGLTSIRCQVLEDNQSTRLYSNTLARNYTSGKLRLKKEGSKIEFFAENLTGQWELLCDYTDVKISASEDLYLYFSSELGSIVGSSSESTSSNSHSSSSRSTSSQSNSVTETESSQSSSSSNDMFSVTFGEMSLTPILAQYDGNIYFTYSYDEDSTSIYYVFYGDWDIALGAISVRIRSASTESGLETASWSAFKTLSQSYFTVSATDRYVQVNIKLLSYEYDTSPILDAITVGNEEFLSSEETPILIAPSQSETFDNILRVIWKKPEELESSLAKRYYKLEYKNEDLGINDWILVDGRINPQAGFYDWNVSDFDEDDNYQIRLTPIYAEVSDLSASLPAQLDVSGAGTSEYDGTYKLVGIHNGENLYEGDNGYIYYDGVDRWLMGPTIDNSSYMYYSTDIIGRWEIGTGDSPAPYVSEFVLSTSESSGELFESSSSSYDFSSTSTYSSMSSSTAAMSTSTSSESTESSFSTSTQRMSTSGSSSSVSTESSSSSESSSSWSTEKVARSSTSSLSSSSTYLLTSSSSSSIAALLRGTGQNEYGQLGLGTQTNVNVFEEIPIEETKNFPIITGGAYHSVVQKSNGTLWITGRNDYGQLGLGDYNDRNYFVQLPSSFNWAKKVVCGEHFTVVEKSDGTVWVCGRNDKGQLGLGDNINRDTFVLLPLKYSNPIHIATGSEFLMIVKQNGYLDAVGANESGQLGLYDNVDRNSFEEVGIRVGKHLSAGSQFAYLSDTSGFVKSTGNNYHGQLGLGDTTNRNRFTEVPDLLSIDSIIAGGGHVFVITASGVLKACGDNNLGQLGVGDFVDRNEFENIGYLNPQLVCAGFHHSFVVASDGNVYSTGYNIYGQLGLGHENNINVFTRVPYLRDPEKVVCCGYHTFALTAYAESESSTEEEFSESSSLSIDDEAQIYPFGYFQFDTSNMADVLGEFTGDTFYIPSSRIDTAILTHVSLSNLGDWELQLYDVGSDSFQTHATLKVGAEVHFAKPSAGDRVRVVFDGPSGTELTSYKIYMRGIPEESSSESSIIIKSTSSVSSSSSPSSVTLSSSSTVRLSSSQSSSSESSSSSSQSSSSLSSSSSESSSSVSSSSESSSSNSSSVSSSSESSSSESSSSVSSSSSESSSSESSSSVSSSSLFFADQTKLTAYDGFASDYFGTSVAIDDRYAIVGAPGAGGTLDYGAAYIFHRTDDNTWDSASVKKTDDIPATVTGYGVSVAIDGDYAVVGAYNASISGTGDGAVYVYHRTGTNTWDAGTRLVSPDPNDYDAFGISVSISGDYLVVGAYLDDAQGLNAGAAYVFRRTGTNTWSAATKLALPGTNTGAKFGTSVAIDGNYIVIGAPEINNTGSAYVYYRTGTNTWGSRVQVKPTGLEGGDLYGWSVDIDGNYIIVSARGDDDKGSGAGAAYIHRRTGTNTWGGGVKILPYDGIAADDFGYSVAINGDYALVGSKGDDNYGSASGSAYVFHRTGAVGVNIWDSGVRINAFDAQSSDAFGSSVALSDSHGIVGAPYEDEVDSNAGAAYVFLRSDTIFSSSISESSSASSSSVSSSSESSSSLSSSSESSSTQILPTSSSEIKSSSMSSSSISSSSRSSSSASSSSSESSSSKSSSSKSSSSSSWSSESSSSESSSSSVSSSSSESSSSSVNVPLAAYPVGYFEFSATNLADSNGDYDGNEVPVSRTVNTVMINYVSADNSGTWTIEKYTPPSTYTPIATPTPGIETTLSTPLNAGDLFRVTFNGPNGTKLYAYRVDFINE